MGLRCIGELCLLLAQGIVAGGLALGGQAVLTNADVLRMVEAKMSVELIQEMIAKSPTDFDTSLESVLELEKKGVPDDLIQFMVRKMEGKDPFATSQTDLGSPVSEERGRLPDEAGVYYRREGSDELLRIEPEVVNWREGGFWMRVATGGLTRGHVNGTVRGPTSHYVLKGNGELVVYCAEGESATEYQLLRLWEKKKRRSFRTLTRGVIHASGGAPKNAVAVDPVRVSSRTYTIHLSDLEPGEYGLLPPTPSATGVTGSLGKIYAFTIGR